MKRRSPSDALTTRSQRLLYKEAILALRRDRDREIKEAYRERRFAYERIMKEYWQEMADVGYPHPPLEMGKLPYTDNTRSVIRKARSGSWANVKASRLEADRTADAKIERAKAEFRRRRAETISKILKSAPA